jgi:hypothetical protein
MRPQSATPAIQPQSSYQPTGTPPDRSPTLGDLRFRALVPEAAWAQLPPAVRHRFSKRLAAGETAVYVGEILQTRMSLLGRWLAQAAWIIGGPFPTECGAKLPSVVTVSEDGATSGQNWTRLYVRRSGFPQIIHSCKRFAGPTGLEEYVGLGVGTALTVHVEERSLVFRSHHYFVEVLGVRLRLPMWMTPGDLSVTHTELGDGTFSFTLDLSHPAFGWLIHQYAIFREIHS